MNRATATRLDKFVDTLLSRCGVLAMIGKAERSLQTVADIARHGVAYFAAVGGAACLLAKAIHAARVVAFDDLGMEAIHEFELQDLLVTVAVDAKGRTVYKFIEAVLRVPSDFSLRSKARPLWPSPGGHGRCFLVGHHLKAWTGRRGASERLD